MGRGPGTAGTVLRPPKLGVFNDLLRPPKLGVFNDLHYLGTNPAHGPWIRGEGLPLSPSKVKRLWLLKHI
jgi:hypothetical protein